MLVGLWEGERLVEGALLVVVSAHHEAIQTRHRYRLGLHRRAQTFLITRNLLLRTDQCNTNQSPCGCPCCFRGTELASHETRERELWIDVMHVATRSTVRTMKRAEDIVAYMKRSSSTQ